MRNEKGFSLITVVFVMLALSSIGIGMSSAISVKASRSVADYEGQHAFYIADGALQYVIADEFIPSSDFTAINEINNKVLGNGTFSVEYSNVSATSAEVTVTAQVGEGVRQVQQTVKKIPIAPGAMHGGGNVNLESSQDGGGTVIGDIVYGGNYTADDGYDVIGAASNGTGPETVDLQPLLNLTTSTHTGNLSITGDYTANIHVTGNVSVSGTGTITGIIVADGNITIDADHEDTRNVNGTLAASGNIIGDFKHTSNGVMTAQEAGGQMQPLFIAAGNVDMEFHQETVVTYRGLIRAGGNINFKLRQEDFVTIEGALIAGGNIDIDSHQETVFNIDFYAGTPYVGSKLVLEDWREL